VSTTHAHLDAADCQRVGLSGATLSMSKVLEDPDDGIADVMAALG
jgi:O-acetylhomoserine/O-acetylserine sulfhydrylase-like pyridoxal-dependent enzyme